MLRTSLYAFANSLYLGRRRLAKGAWRIDYCNTWRGVLLFTFRGEPLLFSVFDRTFMKAHLTHSALEVGPYILALAELGSFEATWYLIWKVAGLLDNCGQTPRLLRSWHLSARQIVVDVPFPNLSFAQDNRSPLQTWSGPHIRRCSLAVAYFEMGYIRNHVWNIFDSLKFDNLLYRQGCKESISLLSNTGFDTLSSGSVNIFRNISGVLHLIGSPHCCLLCLQTVPGQAEQIFGHATFEQPLELSSEWKVDRFGQESVNRGA